MTRSIPFIAAAAVIAFAVGASAQETAQKPAAAAAQAAAQSAEAAKAAGDAAGNAANAAAETAAETAEQAGDAAADAAQNAAEAAQDAAEAAANAAEAAGQAAEDAAQAATKDAAQAATEDAAQAGAAAEDEQAANGQAAPEPLRTEYDDWTVICAASGAPCVMEQVGMTDADEAALNMQIEKLPQPVKLNGGEVKEAANILVPLGVLLQEGVKLRIDGGETLGSPYFLCQPNGCVVRAPLQEQLLTALKRGAAATVSYVLLENGAAREVSVNISLKGFTAAINALP